MVQIKQKKDGTYNLKIIGLSLEGLGAIQALTGLHDSILLKRINKYRKDFGDPKLTEIPDCIGQIFNATLGWEEEENE